MAAKKPMSPTKQAAKAAPQPKFGSPAWNAKYGVGKGKKK